jgi:hypothetical protein
MQYVLLIYQGSAWDRLPDLTESRRRRSAPSTQRSTRHPASPPVHRSGLPENATTVRVEDAVIGDPQVWAEPYFNDAAGERALKQ